MNKIDNLEAAERMNGQTKCAKCCCCYTSCPLPAQSGKRVRQCLPNGTGECIMCALRARPFIQPHTHTHPTHIPHTSHTHKYKRHASHAISGHIPNGEFSPFICNSSIHFLLILLVHRARTSHRGPTSIFAFCCAGTYNRALEFDGESVMSALHSRQTSCETFIFH